MRDDAAHSFLAMVLMYATVGKDPISSLNTEPITHSKNAQGPRSSPIFKVSFHLRPCNPMLNLFTGVTFAKSRLDLSHLNSQ